MWKAAPNKVKVIDVPPGADAQNNDMSIVSSVGYTF